MATHSVGHGRGRDMVRHGPPGFAIGDVEMENPLVLAPMAGVCDFAFRRLCKSMGCALVYTEMISAMALVYDNRRTAEMIKVYDEERPVSVQLFGSDPAVIAEGARLAVAGGADIIDINMGCPAHKIVKSGEGSALMREPARAWSIVSAVKAAVQTPVTVKIRKGWDDSNANAVEFAMGCADAGADAIAVHGRTREQQYSGEADWSVIARVAESVNVPVIGNGDVNTPQDVKRMMDETGCAAVMIGRGALGNPWIFRRALRYLAAGELTPEPGPKERIDMALEHLDLVVHHKGEKTAAAEMRKHLAWYIRGIRGATRVRDQINSAPDTAALAKILAEYRIVLGACE